jgi:AcrR family transcriptional regulator
MARPPLEGIDEKILATTIAYAATRTQGSFSTKEIADQCGISEFTIYQHFKTKKNLIQVACSRLEKAFLAEDEKAFKEHADDYQAFFDEILDFLLAHPLEIKFAANYSLVFPREGQNEDYPDFMGRLSAGFVNLKPILGVQVNQQEYLTLVCFSVREMIQDALYILGGVLSDTPENRKTMARLTGYGIGSFKK